MRNVSSCLLILCVTSVATADVVKSGDRVVVVADAVTIADSTGAARDVRIGTIFSVIETKAKLLRGNFQGRLGWVHRDHVVSIAVAVEHLTRAIEASSDDDEASRRFRWGRVWVWRALGERNRVISECDYFIGVYPEWSEPRRLRARLYERTGKLDLALADLDAVLKLKPKPRDFNLRGNIEYKSGRFTEAIRDYSEAIRRKPKKPGYYRNRAVSAIKLGEYRVALADLTQAISLNGNDSELMTLKALLLASCPDPKIRNGRNALDLALNAATLSDWRGSWELSCLAAAYAELGDFDNAVEWQEKAIELAKAKDKDTFRSRLQLYASGKPFRQTQVRHTGQAGSRSDKIGLKQG